MTGNAITSGPADTGWMTEENRMQAARATPLPRHGQPENATNLASFLFSEHGGWVTAQPIAGSDGPMGSGAIWPHGHHPALDRANIEVMR